MSFTKECWLENEEVFEKILNLPFNQELMKGCLDINKFKFYIYQDSLYLEDYGKALALIASRLDNIDYVADFLDFAKGAITVERILHKNFFQEFSINIKSGKSPSCFSYTNYLLSQAMLASIEVAVAAILPCFWVYMEVGNYIYKNNSNTNNPYQKWIDTYSGEEFQAATQKAIEITEELAQKTTDNNRKLMKEAYQNCIRLEWMFWDSAYKLEKWQP
jgi:thiaminase (transcriptional activator TenA)